MSDSSNKRRRGVAFWLLKIPLFVILVGVAWFIIALISVLLGRETGFSLGWYLLGGGAFFSVIYANRIANKVVNKILTRSDGKIHTPGNTNNN